jgi:hypothetical protein
VDQWDLLCVNTWRCKRWPTQAPAAKTRIVMAAGRVFLESSGLTAAHGRIGMVSLSIYDAEYVARKTIGPPPPI